MPWAYAHLSTGTFEVVEGHLGGFSLMYQGISGPIALQSVNYPDVVTNGCVYHAIKAMPSFLVVYVSADFKPLPGYHPETNQS
jgi:hypothetical protein